MRRVNAVLGGAEHAGLPAATGDAVALEVGDMGGERRRAKDAAPVPDHPGLDDDATPGAEKPVAGRMRSVPARKIDRPYRPNFVPAAEPP